MIYAVVNDVACDFSWDTEIYSTYEDALECINNTTNALEEDGIEVDGFEIVELEEAELGNVFSDYVDCR